MSFFAPAAPVLIDTTSHLLLSIHCDIVSASSSPSHTVMYLPFPLQVCSPNKPASLGVPNH